MSEVFQRTATNLAGVFSADLTTLTLDKAAGSAALVQQLSANYQQAITRLYEIGSEAGKSNVYYVGGRSQGQMNIGRIIGPSVLLDAYYKKFGDVCKAKTNTLVFSLLALDCAPGNLASKDIGVGKAKAKYTCGFCVITQVGITLAAQDMIINESSSLMFSSFDYTGT